MKYLNRLMTSAMFNFFLTHNKYWKSKVHVGVLVQLMLLHHLVDLKCYLVFGISNPCELNRDFSEARMWANYYCNKFKFGLFNQFYLRLVLSVWAKLSIGSFRSKLCQTWTSPTSLFTHHNSLTKQSQP